MKVSENMKLNRQQAMEQYHQLIQKVLTNVIKVAPPSIEQAFTVLNCCQQQEEMSLFYYQDHWINVNQLNNKQEISSQLLSQGPQIIKYINELFKETDVANYAFIQLRYDCRTNEWQSHFVWQDELVNQQLTLDQFITQWQLRMTNEINQW